MTIASRRLQSKEARRKKICAGAGAFMALGLLMPPRVVEAQDAVPVVPNEAQTKTREPIITDRPDFTESTETVPVGMTQVEAGVTFVRSGEERSNSFGEVLVRRAVGRRTELRLEVPTFSRTRGAGERKAGFEDGSIGFKYMLSQGSGELGLKKPRISLIADTSLPIGSRDFRERKLQPGAKLLLGWDLSERIALSSNLNYASLSEEGKRFREFSASASLGFALSERVGSFIEVFGFFPDGKRENTRFVNGGFTYLVNNDFQLDARLGFGLGNRVEGRDMFFGGGVARRF